jgi:hypothetical protein
VTGGGGASLYTVNTPRSTTLAFDADFHYTKLTFSNNGIAGTVTRSDGSLIENFTINHK